MHRLLFLLFALSACGDSSSSSSSNSNSDSDIPTNDASPNTDSQGSQPSATDTRALSPEAAPAQASGGIAGSVGGTGGVAGMAGLGGAGGQGGVTDAELLFQIRENLKLVENGFFKLFDDGNGFWTVRANNEPCNSKAKVSCVFKIVNGEVISMSLQTSQLDPQWLRAPSEAFAACYRAGGEKFWPKGVFPVSAKVMFFEGLGYDSGLQCGSFPAGRCAAEGACLHSVANTLVEERP